MESLEQPTIPDPVVDPALPKHDASSATTSLPWGKDLTQKHIFSKLGVHTDKFTPEAIPFFNYPVSYSTFV